MWGWCWHGGETETGTRGSSWDLHSRVGVGVGGDGMDGREGGGVVGCPAQ